MAGPNFVLDKGYKVKSSATVANVAMNRFVQHDTADTTGQTCTSVSGAGVRVLGVSQETLDSAKIATGKAGIAVRLLGLARVVSDGSGTAIAIGDLVTTDASGRAVKVASTVGSKEVAGVAQTPSSAAGTIIDVLLTPGVTANTAVS
jgi:hypothetical protein